jgi:hypothetical protein
MNQSSSLIRVAVQKSKIASDLLPNTKQASGRPPFFVCT